MDNKCKDCKFCFKSSELEQNGFGECRINPPNFFELNGQMMVGFPRVKLDMWCGQHVFNITDIPRNFKL